MMFRAELWRAIVATAGRKSLSVERPDLRPRRRNGSGVTPCAAKSGLGPDSKLTAAQLLNNAI